MGFDIGALGNLRAQPQATIPVTDASPEAGNAQSTLTGPVISTEDEKFILYGGVTVIVSAIVILWLMGAFAFRGLPSI